MFSKGFAGKCKSLVKPTKTRIGVLRRRAEAKQRFLKEDLAKLLANGLDTNAYGRTEEFLAGLNLLSCYDYIETLCDYIVNQLSTLQKQRECPEECREAVASLMFAAARFSDLPELRDLRDVFQERYGNSLECFVNQKFVEKLSSKCPSAEKRVQLLQDTALEFSVKWDCSGFEKRMCNPSAFVPEQPKKHEPLHVTSNRDGVIKTDKSDVSSTRKTDQYRNGGRLHDGKTGNFLGDKMDFQYINQVSCNGNHKPPNTRGTVPKEGTNEMFSERRELGADIQKSFHGDEANPKTIRSGSSRGIRSEAVDDGSKLCSDVANIFHKAKTSDNFFHIRSEIGSKFSETPSKNGYGDVSLSAKDHVSQYKHLSRARSEEETNQLKQYYKALPPPYLKSNNTVIPPPYVKSIDSKSEAISRSESCKDATMNGFGNIHKESEHSVHRRQCSSPAGVNSYSPEEDPCYRNEIPLPKPRSMRRKHSKSSSHHDDVDLEGEVSRRNSRKREHLRRGLQNLMDDERYHKDEEERMIDKLLLHYSKKPSTYDAEKLRKQPRAHPSDQVVNNAAESSSSRSRDVHRADSEKVLPPRSISLPREQPASSEMKKVFARANSFQPDNQARHVHPKLPDYDDLAARFSALRGLQ